mgnify:CR=1 FL=1
MARAKAKASKTTQGAINNAIARSGAKGAQNKDYTKGANAASKAGKSGMAAHKAGLKAASLS